MNRLSKAERVYYEEDVAESNRRYNKAYGHVLAHTSVAEQTAFWKPFSEVEHLPDGLVTSQGGDRAVAHRWTAGSTAPTGRLHSACE